MNDPYKNKRLALCKQQTMLHNANCTRCEKIMGLPILSDRSNICHKCDIGEELRNIGKELLKFSRPRVKAPIIYGVPSETKQRNSMTITVEEYLRLKKEYKRDVVIEKVLNVSHDTMHRFKRKNGLTRGAV